jgi:hypothetical protein
VPGFENFERWVVENEIPDEERPVALARWLGKQTRRPPLRFERVEPGHEQILADREQRDLDGLPSALDAEWPEVGSDAGASM